jgi:hypothetical protein
MSRLQIVWDWISTKGNQTTLVFIGGGLAAILTGAWAVYLHFSKKPSASPTVTASEGGMAAGGNISVTASPGGTAIVAAGNVTIGGIRPHDSKTYGKGINRWLKGINCPRNRPCRWKSGCLDPRVPRSDFEKGPMKSPV